MERVIHTTHGHVIRACDVLQVKRRGEWMDFSTLRTKEDAVHAVAYVQGRRVCEGAEAFRISTGRGTYIIGADVD